MSVADLSAELEAALVEDEVEPNTFIIDDLTKADWAVRKVAQARRRLSNAVEVAQAERARIDDWLEAEKTRAENSQVFLLDQLERFHRTVLDEDPKAKTLRLPGGELVARKTPDRVEVDAETFTGWAQGNGHAELLRVNVEPDKPALKRFTRPEGDTVVHIETGEVVPGVAFSAGSVEFSVKVAD